MIPGLSEQWAADVWVLDIKDFSSAFHYWVAVGLVTWRASWVQQRKHSHVFLFPLVHLEHDGAQTDSRSSGTTFCPRGVLPNFLEEAGC